MLIAIKLTCRFLFLFFVSILDIASHEIHTWFKEMVLCVTDVLNVFHANPIKTIQWIWINQIMNWMFMVEFRNLSFEDKKKKNLCIPCHENKFHVQFVDAVSWAAPWMVTLLAFINNGAPINSWFAVWMIDQLLNKILEIVQRPISIIDLIKKNAFGNFPEIWKNYSITIGQWSN